MAELAAVLAALPAAGWLFQRVGGWRDRSAFPLAGRLVRIAGCELHVVEQGSHGPAVVLEAGLAASSLNWSRVQPLVADFAHVVSYDRRGLGWSGPCNSRRTLPHMADELRVLLETAKVAPPYILVGHSFGALIVRAFAHQRADLVAGLVLVDPVSIKTWAACSASDKERLTLGAKLSRRGAWLARFGVVRFALAAAGWRYRGITRRITRASAGNATPFLGRLVGEVQKLPAQAVRIVRAQWSMPKPFEAMAVYLENLPDCARQAAAMSIAEHIPLVVLSAATATENEIEEREQWLKQSEHGQHIEVADTGHWLHLEKPELVAEAVRKMVGRERGGSVSHGVDDVIHPDAKA